MYILTIFQVGKSYKSSNCEKEFRCVHEDGHSHWKTYNLPGCLARKARCRAKDGELKCLCNRNLVGDGITKCEREYIYSHFRLPFQTDGIFYKATYNNVLMVHCTYFGSQVIIYMNIFFCLDGF